MWEPLAFSSRSRRTVREAYRHNKTSVSNITRIQRQLITQFWKTNAIALLFCLCAASVSFLLAPYSKWCFRNIHICGHVHNPPPHQIYALATTVHQLLWTHNSCFTAINMLLMYDPFRNIWLYEFLVIGYSCSSVIVILSLRIRKFNDCTNFRILFTVFSWFSSSASSCTFLILCYRRPPVFTHSIYMSSHLFLYVVISHTILSFCSDICTSVAVLVVERMAILALLCVCPSVRMWTYMRISEQTWLGEEFPRRKILLKLWICIDIL